jgi:hypothetical protein
MNKATSKTMKWLVLAAVALVMPLTASAETVTVTGQSAISEREAINDALRNAVERVGEVQIASWSKVQNYELVQDVIKSRVSGLVTDHEVIESGKTADGVFTVHVRAEVSRQVLDATWADVQNLMEQLGEPTIMLFFDDLKQIVGAPDPESFGRQSPVTNKIVKVLTDSGFRVIHRNRFEFLKSKNMLDARDEERFALYKAEDTHGADIYLDGMAMAEGPMFLQRTGLYKWRTTARCAAYWSDSGEILFSTDLEDAEKNYADPSDVNAIKLLNYTANELAAQIRGRLLETLARRAVEGGIITIKFDNADIDQQFEIEDFLKEMESASSVRLVRRHDTAVILELRTKLLLSELERKLLRTKFDGFRFGAPQTEGRTVVFRVRPTE